MGVVNATPRPHYSRKREPILQEAWKGPERSGRVRKISPPGFDPRTVQPVATCYTDCAMPAHTTWSVYIECACSLIILCVEFYFAPRQKTLQRSYQHGIGG